MLNFKKIKIGDKAEQISKDIDYNFKLLENELNICVQNLSSRIDSLNRFCQDFVENDFNDGILEIVLPNKWTAESNITVYEKKTDNTFEIVFPEIKIINSNKFLVITDVVFNGKVAVSYE